MKMTDYLGKHVSNMLEEVPFKDWPVEKSVEDDLEEQRIYYVFEGRGLDVRCDRDETVCVIFLHSEGFDESLSEVPFTLSREQVLEHFGPPSMSGQKISDAILGDCGAWDRFSEPDLAIHIEYRTDSNGIRMITLMLSDVVP